MSAWWMFLIVPVAGLLELVINYFFSRKIRYVSKEEYKKAGQNGAIATFLFSTLVVGLSMLMVLADGWTIWQNIIYLFASATSIAIGNYYGTILLNKGKKKNG